MIHNTVKRRLSPFYFCITHIYQMMADLVSRNMLQCIVKLDLYVVFGRIISNLMRNTTRGFKLD
jgi:hypothetical protein